MYRSVIKAYVPVNAQEASDKAMMLDLIECLGDKILTRESTAAHMTASSMIFNKARDKVLLIYHHIYQSFAWTGGHSDGEPRLLYTAAKEAMEETGLSGLRLIPVSEVGAGKVKDLTADGTYHQWEEDDIRAAAAIDVLTVKGHVKKGKYVSAHLHLNVSYLFEADEASPICCKPDENSAVAWVECSKIAEVIDEPWMLPVYDKLIKRGLESLESNCR